MTTDRRTEKVDADVSANLLEVANRLTEVMDMVRLDACKSQPMNHLWVMDTLHDVRQYIYSLRIALKNAAQ